MYMQLSKTAITKFEKVNTNPLMERKAGVSVIFNKHKEKP